MKKTKPNTIISRASITTISIAALFVLIYVFIISYTYNSLFDNARTNILKSTVSSSTSFSKIVASDLSQVEYISVEFEQQYYEIMENKDTYGVEYLKKFLNDRTPGSCEALTYFGLDGVFFSSDGRTGKISDMDLFQEQVENASVFTTTNKDKSPMEYAYFAEKIYIENDFKGYIVGTYDFSKIVNDIYPDDIYKESSANYIISDDGEVQIATSNNKNVKTDIGNFFEFVKKNKSKERGALIENQFTSGDSSIITITLDDTKYVAVYSPLPDFPDIYIARIIPAASLFSKTGNYLSYMTIASFIFFFAIVFVAYRYYKTVSISTEKITTITLTDPLTGYANFAKFKEDAEEQLKKNRNKEYYICCADIVGFRYINDAFGYDTGDQILIAITEELDELLYEDEIFARVSGDKFIILTQRDFADTDKNLFIYQLTDRISSINPLAKSHIRLEVQMGIYKILPGDIDHMSINALYDRCLVALYSIEHIDTGIAIYDASIHNEQVSKREIESKMHQALKDGEFRVYVQPKYKTSNGKLAAGEALIRWVDPEKGIIPPIKFIPLFEQNRFVHDVDLYVMEVVCRFLRMRINDGLPVVPISLNISPVEITMPNFCESYISIKEKYEIPNKLVELEFTEGIFFENEELFKDVIVNFQNHGFTCSMDDFGSGYSSLNILKDLPVDTLKLDKLFFRESENTSRDRSIIRSVVAMARSLNIKTVAEGVETLDTVDFLKLIGCTLIQGYIYSQPLPLTEFEERLNTENIESEDESKELDFDKFEIVPLDMPLSTNVDNSLRRTYAAIMEINTGGNIYHIYYPGESKICFDGIPDRGFYSALLEDLVSKYIHPEDREKAKEYLNPLYLSNHFKKNKELDFEYRHMKKDGTYSWVKIHLIKATGGRSDSQIFFAYFNIVDDYKETEENLQALQGRFTAAYSNFNGTIFELDIKTGNLEMLEAHSNLLSAVKDVKDYDVMKEFIVQNLLHPDYKEMLAAKCSMEYLQKHFLEEQSTQPISVEVLAKPSRKSDSYCYYIANYTPQNKKTKILLTVEDATERKIDEIRKKVQHQVTDIAFSNIYDSVTKVYLEKDLYEKATYVGDTEKTLRKSEGKYSIAWSNVLDKMIRPEDRETLDQIFSIESLTNFYRNGDTNQFKITYQERHGEHGQNYEWNETLVIAVPNDFGQEDSVFMFKRSIEEEKMTETNLNEFAYRLSYSLAMFDYAYSVDCSSEKVELIGGLKFGSDVFNEADNTYSKITLMVKNTLIAENDQPTFRRFTYIDELQEYFSSNPAMVTRYFKAIEGDEKSIEVSAIYGAREQKITFFVRTLDRSLMERSTDTVATEETVESMPYEEELTRSTDSVPPPEKNLTIQKDSGDDIEV